MAEQRVTFVGPGKGFNVSGLGCAFAVIPHEERRQRFTQELWLRSLHPTSMGLVAAWGAYSGACEEWLAALRAYLTAIGTSWSRLYSRNCPACTPRFQTRPTWDGLTVVITLNRGNTGITV